MNEGKQHIFMQRVLFIFEVTKQKAGKAQVLRMPVSQWALECDICCMAGYVLEQMQHRKNSDNLIVFPEETIKLVMNRLIEGDFHEELKPMLEGRDPGFSPEMCSMWADHLPAAAAPSDGSELVKADETLDSLTKQNFKLQFEADALALARDAAQLARLYTEESKSERTSRVAKVCHLRQENHIGSTLAAQFMSNNCHHRAGTPTELQEELMKFVTKLKADNGSLIIWLDYMKLGRLSTQDLNVTMDCVRKALASMPERGVCFAIAPHLVSDRRSGLRAEMRRIEDKMDAKKLYAESITLRTPRDLLPWTPEHMYVVPTGRDAVPHASEGVRSLSDVQETAQLLAGEALPQSVIASLLKGSEAHSLIGVVNLTPYEGNLELSMIKSSIEKQMHTFRSLSLSTDLTLIQHCERECAMFLFEDPALV
ncbi:unnamed protein product [Durusdinium trenchii]|uniref:Uncharacterized protein n=1 Tax=Durusdinium trenchii TaxID=1381693 RepID=A0ABP0ILV7_9DINO